MISLSIRVRSHYLWLLNWTGREGHKKKNVYVSENIIRAHFLSYLYSSETNCNKGPLSRTVMMEMVGMSVAGEILFLLPRPLNRSQKSDDSRPFRLQRKVESSNRSYVRSTLHIRR